MGAPTATVLLMLSSTARAFVRPVGPAALSGARWSKVNSASQVGCHTKRSLLITQRMLRTHTRVRIEGNFKPVVAG